MHHVVCSTWEEGPNFAPWKNSQAAVGTKNASSAPAHGQAISVDGQVSTTGRQQRELGDHLLRELQDRQVQDNKGQFACMPHECVASLCATPAHLAIGMKPLARRRGQPQPQL